MKFGVFCNNDFIAGTIFNQIHVPHHIAMGIYDEP